MFAIPRSASSRTTLFPLSAKAQVRASARLLLPTPLAAEDRDRPGPVPAVPTNLLTPGLDQAPKVSGLIRRGRVHAIRRSRFDGIKKSAIRLPDAVSISFGTFCPAVKKETRRPSVCCTLNTAPQQIGRAHV